LYESLYLQGFLGQRQSLSSRILVCNEALHAQPVLFRPADDEVESIRLRFMRGSCSDYPVRQRCAARSGSAWSPIDERTRRLTQIRVRVPSHLRELAEDRARRENTTVSEIARDALERALRPQRRDGRVQLELHRALLGKLISDSDGVRALAVRNLAKSRKVVRGDQALGWLNEWQALLDGPPGPLVDVLLGSDEHSVDLRQVSPFAGALSDDERLTAINRAGNHAPH
jgi:hypothetical protein